MLELTDLHIDKSYDKDPVTNKYRYCYRARITIGDKKRELTIRLEEKDAIKIIEPVINVITNALDVEKEELRKELISSIEKYTKKD